MKKFTIYIIAFLSILPLISACSTTTTTGTDATQAATVSRANKPDIIKLLNSTKIAALTSRLKDKIHRLKKNNHRQHSKINQRKYSNREYNKNWENKIQQAAVCNIPTSLLKKDVTGKVLLDVEINADGSVNKIAVLKSSGVKVLDDAATNIVNLAKPFAPLTPEILANTNTYHITRTWNFNCGKKTVHNN